jgi:putative adhesin Stv-like protein
MAEDLRGMGRPDNELVLSGHGGIRDGDGTSVTVPQGTSVAMYSPHGTYITDPLGNLIETASPPPLEVYAPGEKLPDYTLTPPVGLVIRGLPRTVTSATRPVFPICFLPTWEESTGQPAEKCCPS